PSELTYSSSTYDQMIKQAGPTAYWPLDEASGTTNHAFDVTGNLHNATISGTPTLGGSPAQGTGNFVGTGSSWLFNSGSSSSVTAMNSSAFNTTPITYEAWVKPSAVGGFYTIMTSEGTGGPSGYGFRQRNDGSYWFVLGGNGYGDSASSPAHVATVGKWTHLVGTYDGSTLKLYVNGLLAGSVASR